MAFSPNSLGCGVPTATRIEAQSGLLKRFLLYSYTISSSLDLLTQGRTAQRALNGLHLTALLVLSSHPAVTQDPAQGHFNIQMGGAEPSNLSEQWTTHSIKIHQPTLCFPRHQT